MSYGTSFNSGIKPFMPDQERGFWTAPNDFICICLGLAFKMDLFIISYFYFLDMGIVAILQYLVPAAFIIIPLMVILMYLGQFSSTGFITAFRISPFFKGIGFVSLFLNITLLLYYGIFAIIPLIYLLNSWQPTLPWSCEGALTWVNVSEVNFGALCNSSEYDWNTTVSNEPYLFRDPKHITHLPSIAYISTYFKNFTLYKYQKVDYQFSWAFFACNLLLWSIIALIFYRFPQTERLGRILRNLFWTVIGLMIVCLIRFSLLPGAFDALSSFFSVKYGRNYYDTSLKLVSIFHVFGSGCGLLVALSSHNRFHSNIMRFSWIICMGQLIISMGFAIISRMIQKHFEFVSDDNYNVYVDSHWILYLSAGSALINIAWPNLWCFLYYLMLFLGALLVMLTVLKTVFTSLFDEFEMLRNLKTESRMGLITALALGSSYMCSNEGILYFGVLSLDSAVVQILISLLILLVVLWVYGRLRFQRDIEFMLGQRFTTWKVYCLRFLGPIALGLWLLFIFFIAFHEHRYLSTVFLSVIGLVVLPWLFVPVYATRSMLQSTGTLCTRFKRSCQPTNWYPVDRADRQRYDEYMGEFEVTQQLTDLHDEAL